MADWYEVFDNEQVQLLTRKRVAALGGGAVVLLVLTLVALALAHRGLVPLPVLAAFVGGGWAAAALVALVRLRRLRRVVWCVKLSDARIVGYDYARHKTPLDWHDVARIELAPQGLLLVGPGRLSLVIPHLFPEYATLSHRVVAYAERHQIPVFVDGRPWELLDVYAVFPFLHEVASPEGSTRGRL